jgi:hypothetical protein
MAVVAVFGQKLRLKLGFRAAQQQSSKIESKYGHSSTGDAAFPKVGLCFHSVWQAVRFDWGLG